MLNTKFREDTSSSLQFTRSRPEIFQNGDQIQMRLVGKEDRSIRATVAGAGEGTFWAHDDVITSPPPAAAALRIAVIAVSTEPHTMAMGRTSEHVDHQETPDSPRAG